MLWQKLQTFAILFAVITTNRIPFTFFVNCSCMIFLQNRTITHKCKPNTNVRRGKMCTAQEIVAGPKPSPTKNDYRPEMVSEQKRSPATMCRRTPTVAEHKWSPNTKGHRSKKWTPGKMIAGAKDCRTNRFAKHKWSPNTNVCQTKMAADQK